MIAPAMTYDTSLVLLRCASIAVLLACSGAACADALPSGRYRCYEPPSYVVVSWFDILPDRTYRFQGEAPARFAYEAGTRELRWREGELATSHAGATYHPPAADAPARQRHTIVLESRGESGGTPTECYLTTH